MRQRIYIFALFSLVLLLLLTLGSCYRQEPIPSEVSFSDTVSDTESGTGHIHTVITVPESPATCTANGYTEHTKCSDCGVFISYPSVLPMLSHTSVDTPDAAGSCTENAYKGGKHCSVCGAVTENPTDLGRVHGAEEDIPEVPGTCVSKGLAGGKRCTLCKATTVHPYTTDFGHDIVSVPAVAGTCTVEGKSEGSMCTICKKTLVHPQSTGLHHTGVVTIPEKLGTCKSQGMSEGKKCDDCGTVIVAPVVTDYVHKIENHEEIPGGCGTFGSPAGEYCSLCRYLMPSTLIYPSKPHTLGSNGKCSTCGIDMSPTDGIEYESVDGKYYLVSDFPALDFIVVPETYKGLPVRGFVNSFYAYDDLTYSVYLPKTAEFLNLSNPYSMLGSTVLCIDEANPYFSSKDGFLIDLKSKTLYKYMLNEKNVVLPNDGSIVTVDSSAFNMNKTVERIVLPDSVKYIDDVAFGGCSQLKEIVISEGVLEIGERAFASCTSLESIILPESLTEVGERLFVGCETLKSVRLPSSMKTIPERFFERCGLTEFVIPDGITEVGANAFDQCANLQKLVIPKTVSKFPQSAIAKCQSLKEIVIAKENEFYSCENGFLVDKKSETLIAMFTTGSEIVISGDAGFTKIGGLIFYGYGQNLSPQYLSIGEGIKEIGENCFNRFANTRNIAYVKNILIPASVEVIGDYAFSYALNLQTVVFAGNNLKRIGAGAFRYCEKLQSVVIPEGVTHIGDSAFADCTSLYEVDLPKTLGEIGIEVFADDTALKTVRIAECMPLIGESMFKNCGKLTEIILPEGITEIRSNAFAGTKISKINFPSSLLTIFGDAFWNVDSLSEITLADGNTAFTLTNGCLIEKETETLVLSQKYNIGNVIPSDGSVTRIGEFAFSLASFGKDFAIPGCITEVGDAAFYGAKFETAPILPENLTKIGVSAFMKSIIPGTIAVPGGVLKISEYAFQNCEKLTSVTFGEGLSEIGTNAFKNCTSLNKIEFPDSLTVLGSGAFDECSSLLSVTFGKGIKYISAQSFVRCKALNDIEVRDGNPNYFSKDGFIVEKKTMKLIFAVSEDGTVEIPEALGIKSVGKYAFSADTPTCIIIPEGVTVIDGSAFEYLYRDNEFNLVLPASLRSIQFSMAMPMNLKIRFNGTINQWKKIEKADQWTIRDVECKDGIAIGSNIY